MIAPLNQDVLEWFHLDRDPFATEATLATLTNSEQRAAGFVRDCVTRESGASLVLGSAGAGKSRIVDALVAGRATTGGDELEVYAVRGREVGGQELRLVGPLARGLGVPSRTPSYRLYHEIEERARRAADDGVRSLLLVDEAEALGARPLASLVALWNLSVNEFVIQFALFARPEFLTTLRSPQCRALESRVGIDVCGLEPMSTDECAAFVRRALESAGGGPAILSDEALRLIAGRRAYPGSVAESVRQTLELAYERAEMSVSGATAGAANLRRANEQALAS